MQIYIELVTIVIVLLIFISWRVWYKFSLKRAIKKYNPNDDLSRKGEEKRRGIGEGESGVETTSPRVEPTNNDSDRPIQPEGHKLLPKASSGNDGKNYSGFRKLFKRHR